MMRILLVRLYIFGSSTKYSCEDFDNQYIENDGERMDLRCFNLSVNVWRMKGTLSFL